MPSLSDILREGLDANQQRLDGQRQGAGNRVQTPTESIDDLLKKGQKTRGRVVKENKNGDARVSDLPDLDSLVNSKAQRKSTPENPPAPSAKPDRSLNQIINASRSEDAAAKEDQKQNGAKLKIRKLLGFAMIGLLVILAVRNQVQPTVPESTLAQQLLEIVGGVERYRLENNRMPKDLSTLAEFPEGAVEWSVDQYDMQLKTSALELFYWEDASGYIVMSRYGNEAWMYTENGKPKLRKIAAR